MDLGRRGGLRDAGDPPLALDVGTPRRTEGATVKLPASLLARQTPAVRAALAKAQARGSLVTHDVTREGDVVVITLRGLRLPNFANISPRAAIRAKCQQRDVLRPILADLALPPLPWDVDILRIAPKLCDVGDNTEQCGKKLRDLIAKHAGVDDATDEIVRYAVRQERGIVAVRITIRPRG